MATTKKDHTKLDAATAAYRYIYDALDAACSKGAYDIKEANAIFNTCQPLELYMNRIIAAEKEVKDVKIPAEPVVDNKRARECLDGLFNAAELANNHGAFKVVENVKIYNTFNDLRTWLAERSAQDTAQAALVTKVTEVPAADENVAPAQ